MADPIPSTAVIRTPPQHGRAVQSLQAGQEHDQVSQGHTFGDTIIRDQASAHFGDSYTSYNFYNTSSRANSTTRIPLTIGDALTGILAASARAIARISVLSNPSPTLRDIKEEFTGLRVILSSLQRFVASSSSVAPERASLIELEDVVTVMTQLVLLYSQFEALIDGEVGEKRRQWNLISRKGATATRLLNGLQRHKSTLSIILQILQCQFNHEAQNQAFLLSMRTEHELQGDSALAERFLHLVPIEDADGDVASIDCGLSNITLNVEAGATNSSFPPSATDITMPRAAFPQPVAGGASITGEISFGIVVAQSRVYRRVEHREIDTGSINHSARSRGWSILSGLSASRVTCVGVISLPLHHIELVRFRKYLPAPAGVDQIQGTVYPLPDSKKTRIARRLSAVYPDHHLRNSAWCTSYGVEPYPQESRLLNHDYLERLRIEFIRDASDWPVGIRASPIGDDLTRWQAIIEGPIDTPFEGGNFFLRIQYSGLYPFRPPTYTFTTRIYHPNIDEAGNISLNVLGIQYSPALTTLKMLLSISSLLDDPNVDEPLVPEIAHVYKNDRAVYNATAREWTRLYATGPAISWNDKALDKLLQVEEPQFADAQDHTSMSKCQRVVEIEPADAEIESSLDMSISNRCEPRELSGKSTSDKLTSDRSGTGELPGVSAECKPPDTTGLPTMTGALL